MQCVHYANVISETLTLELLLDLTDKDNQGAEISESRLEARLCKLKFSI